MYQQMYEKLPDRQKEMLDKEPRIKRMARTYRISPFEKGEIMLIGKDKFWEKKINKLANMLRENNAKKAQSKSKTPSTVPYIVSNENKTLIGQHEEKSGPYEVTNFNRKTMNNMNIGQQRAYLMEKRLTLARRARNKMKANWNWEIQMNTQEDKMKRNRNIAAEKNRTRSRTPYEQQVNNKHLALNKISSLINTVNTEEKKEKEAQGITKYTPFTEDIMNQLSNRDLFKKLIIDGAISNLNVGDNKFKFIQEYLILRLNPMQPKGTFEFFIDTTLKELRGVRNKTELDAFKEERVEHIRQYNYLFKQSTSFLGKLFKRQGGSQKAQRQTQRQRRQRKQKKTRKRFYK